MAFDPGGTLGEDWDEVIRSLPLGRPELDLEQCAAGDRVLVKTKNTAYLFYWLGAGRADLRASNSRAPAGPVLVMGCTMNLSSSIRPDRLVCGDNLEFTYEQGKKTWTTSPIIEIHLWQHSS